MNFIWNVLLTLTAVNVVWGSSIPHRISANTLLLYGSPYNQTTQEDLPVDHILYAVNAGFGPSKWEDGSLDYLSVITLDCCTKEFPNQGDLPDVSNLDHVLKKLYKILLPCVDLMCRFNCKKNCLT
jgi:hypothetical protein